MKLRRVVAPTIAILAAVPATAVAHVSLHPNTVPTGSFATLGIRVPSELEKTSTDKIVVQMPPGFIDASTQAIPGWSATEKTTKLAKPVKTDDGVETEQVSQITWTGHGPLGKIPSGEFQTFPISVEIPGKAGSVLSFKTLQYYDNGKVVRWIGPPDSDTPAPTVDVTAAGGVLEDVAGGEAGPAGSAPTATPAPTAETASSGGSDHTLAIIALIVGAVGVAVGATALRRRPTA